MMVNTTPQIARDQRDNSAGTESAPDAVRSLGSLEHLFWLLDRHHFVHFAVTALISGRTSPCDWWRALDHLQKRHPVLSICIDGEPGSVPTFRQADAAPIPLRIVEDEPELRWEAEVGKELATPFNPSRAPLIRAVLIQGARDAAFVLVAHHSIADGLSLAYAIRDTLDALAGRFPQPLPWLPSQDDMMNVSDSLVDGPEQDQAGAAMPAIYRPNDRACPTVKGLQLSPGLTSSIRDRARQEGTTVHGALCAALVFASRETFAAWREIPLRILSPINARPLLDAGESCGLFLGAATSTFDRQAMDFWDIARDASIGVAANKTSEKIAAQLSAFRRVVGNGADAATVAEFVAKVFASEVLLTNLGGLSFDRQFGPVTLKAMFGPAVLTGFESHQTIGVATVNGTLCLLHTSHTPPEGLLEKIRSVLALACDGRV
jgi:Phthiocerol/phthiodiolone dimycocerosyl transferase C-terminus/Condensation domain